MNTKSKKGIKPVKRERANTSKGHFINNAELLRALKESKEAGQMTPEFAEMLLRLVENYKRHPWFCRYPDAVKDEMAGDALENLVKKWERFDLNRSPNPNPFAYFTQACYRTFSEVKKQEQKERLGRNKLMVQQNLNPSWEEDGGEGQ